VADHFNAAMPGNLKTDAPCQEWAIRASAPGRAGGSSLQPIAPIVRPAMQVRDRQHEDVAVVDGVDQPVREPAETAAANIFAEQMPSLRKRAMRSAADRTSIRNALSGPGACAPYQWIA